MKKGITLEKRVNLVNLKSRQAGESLILQIPTPLTLTKTGVIPATSTVDFAGLIAGGRFLAFDTKETHSKTSFPLSNIKQHQLIYLDLVDKLGGIGFFLIHFVEIHPDSAFCVPVKYIKQFIETKKRKSIPLIKFQKGWLVPIDTYLQEVIDIYELQGY